MKRQDPAPSCDNAGSKSSLNEQLRDAPGPEVEAVQVGRPTGTDAVVGDARVRTFASDPLPEPVPHLFTCRRGNATVPEHDGLHLVHAMEGVDAPTAVREEVAERDEVVHPQDVVDAQA